jgi:hypothetical protein
MENKLKTHAEVSVFNSVSLHKDCLCMYIFVSTGPGYALSLTINVEQYEYTSEPIGGAGIQVIILFSILEGCRWQLCSIRRNGVLGNSPIVDLTVCHSNC